VKKASRKNPGSTKEAREQQEALREYRMAQTAIAVFRDNGYCVNCYNFLGQVKKYDHVHHTEGRGTRKKEHYTKLVCLCIYCHKRFSAMRQPNKLMHRKQKKLIRTANASPINPCFVQFLTGTDGKNVSYGFVVEEK